MIIDDFKRNEANEVVAICGEKEVILPAEYVAKHKPDVGHEIVEAELSAEVEAPAEAEVEAPEEK